MRESILRLSRIIDIYNSIKSPKLNQESKKKVSQILELIKQNSNYAINTMHLKSENFDSPYIKWKISLVLEEFIDGECFELMHAVAGKDKKKFMKQITSKDELRESIIPEMQRYVFERYHYYDAAGYTDKKQLLNDTKKLYHNLTYEIFGEKSVIGKNSSFEKLLNAMDNDFLRDVVHYLKLAHKNHLLKTKLEEKVNRAILSHLSFDLLEEINEVYIKEINPSKASLNAILSAKDVARGAWERVKILTKLMVNIIIMKDMLPAKIKELAEKAKNEIEHALKYEDIEAVL